MKSSPATILFWNIAENGVVLEQVGQCFRAGEIVHCNKFNFRIFQGGAKDIAPDAPETVDSNFYSHAFSLGLWNYFNTKHLMWPVGQTQPILRY